MTTPPPQKCPACGSDEIEIVVGASLSLVDKKRRLTSGRLGYGTCKTCGARFEQYSALDRDAMEQQYRCSVLTDEQWQQEVLFWSGSRKHGTRR